MKILVIGASGFIGNACFNYFSTNNETIGVDHANLASNTIIADPDFVYIPKLIAQNFDVILNCAGSSNVQDSFVNTNNDFQLNVILVQRLLELIKEVAPKTKLINLSSAAVYGNPSVLPINENSPKNPLSPYGFHKLLSEQIISHYSTFFNLKALSVRIFSAYGPNLKRQFFYDIYKKFSTKNNHIDLIGTGSESRDFIYISDIIEAFEILIHNAKFDGEIYNVASERESFILPTSQLFAAICGYTGEIRFTKKQFDGYPINWKADIGKISSLGFTPKIELEEGLTSYFNWIKNNA